MFSALILVYGGSVIMTMNMLQYDSILKIPTGAVYSIIPVCGVLIIFYSIYNLCEILRKKKGECKRCPIAVQVAIVMGHRW